MREILKSKTIIGFIVIVLSLTIYGSRKTNIVNNFDNVKDNNSMYLYNI